MYPNHPQLQRIESVAKSVPTKMHLLSLLAVLATATLTRATDCIAGVTLSPNSTDAANPLFRVKSTGLEFYKYASNIGNVTDAQMVAIEYLSAYATDTEGNLWVVNDVTYGVAKLTPEYRDYFGVGLDLSPSDKTFTVEEDRFQELLATVSDDVNLQAEAQEWVAEAKAIYHAQQQESLVSRSPLDKRVIRCGSDSCSSDKTCKETSSKCGLCFESECYYSLVGGGC
ncbi:hypothetical protein BO78DRAFT_433502 [Aspergillus sclerotiicarbonarius CBS 121057]|uniref:Uncharacterized protein n=1 Tax=Aspergillus sclerotiicarbonarius (strain CBS 121057 / IBT 28362) TaxID=1448318 RepID=A0A319DWI5_ASPSB|nr:hypothetical protein BO78DRAFT_433502 [Aspergillus sclerotiicarbonarius CBS 121057]